MKLSCIVAPLILGLTRFVGASPMLEADLTTRAELDLEKRAIYGYYFVTTYGSLGCQGGSQGTSHFQADKYECAQMGNAQSFDLTRAIRDQCTLIEVTYHHNADCPEGEEVRKVNYALPGCVDIPTDIGDHFSATFKCIA